jgi:hypothetical protein
MFRAFIIVFTLFLFIGCNSSDDSPQTSTSTELEGTWQGEERDTNVTTVIEMNGDSFSYISDPQLSMESYNGTFTITDHGNPRKMTMSVTNAADPLFVGETSLCLYSIDTAKENIVLACNGPGNTNYPAGFTPTNETRVWDFGKQTNNTSAIDLLGTWSGDCLASGGQSASDVITFMSNGNVIRQLNYYPNTTCSGSSLAPILEGTYSIGGSLTTTGGYTAFELDAFFDTADGVALPSNERIDMYMIFYIDNAGTLFFGKSVDQPGGSSDPANRPNTIEFLLPYQRQ